MKRDWIPIPKDLSDKWDARITETARKNPDWIPGTLRNGGPLRLRGRERQTQ